MAICSQCGTDFEVDKSKRNWAHIKLCSDACRRAKAADRKREKYKKRVVDSAYCACCGKQFQPAQNIGARQKYCSRECLEVVRRKDAHEKWSDERRMKICAHCETEFLPAKFAGGRQIYCSHKCQVAAIHKRHGGKYKRRGKGLHEFNVMRPAVLDRDKVCVLCGSDDRPQVHHWDNSGRSDNCNNSLDNLAVLCGDCHSAIHKVTLAKVDGEWCLDGRIFEVVGLDGPIPIKK